MAYPRQQSAEAWANDLNFAGLERRHGIPSGTLVRLVHQESRGNCDARSPAGALGLCQFMPATARGMGVNPLDPKSSIEGAAKYLEDMMDMFDGDINKALAAYNYGPGNMRALLRNHPDDWQSHLPKETRDYVAKIGSGIGRTYRQRAEDGTLSDDDRTQEVERERRRLNEMSPGLGDQFGGNEILGFFFALIKFFLDAKYPETASDRRAPEIVTPPAQVAAGRTTSPARA